MTETNTDSGSRFKKMVWDDFCFDDVIADLLLPRAYPHHHTLLVRALGAWLIAPNDPDDRRDAVRAGVRLALSKYEREIFRLPKEEQFHKFGKVWQQKLGPAFFAEVYAEIGGISALNRLTDLRQRKKLIKKDHHSAFRNLQEIIRLMHHASLQEWPSDKYHNISLNRCYKALHEFNVQKLTAARYATEKQLQNYLRNYGKTAVLVYAARKTLAGSDRNLFSIFTNHKSAIPDRVNVLNEWLAAVGYLNREVINRVDSKDLNFTQSLGIVSDRFRVLRAPKLTDLEIEVFDRVMHKSYKG